MAFADLIAPDTLFAAERDRLTEWLDAFKTAGSVREIMLEPAREALRSDILRAWSLDVSLSADLSELERRAALASVDPELRAALALKQLELAYLSQAGSPDSLNYRMYLDYRQRYAEAISAAPTWGYLVGVTSIGSVRQMI